MRIATVSLLPGLWLVSAGTAMAQEGKGLWSIYDRALKGTKYIDPTHVIAPNIPVWRGFGPSKFERAKAGADIAGLARKGDGFTYERHGFEATSYSLTADQFGTQLDPPPRVPAAASQRRPAEGE